MAVADFADRQCRQRHQTRNLRRAHPPRYPADSTIHLVVDNLNIHRRKSLTDLLANDIGAEIWDRLTIHYTPTH